MNRQVDSSETVSFAIVEAVGEFKGCDPTSLPPLEKAIKDELGGSP